MEKRQIQAMFRKYKIRMLLEAAARALLGGLAAGAAALFFLSLWGHFTGQTPETALMIALFAGTAAAVFALLFFGLWYPTREKVAARIDEAGLQERAGTMLAFRDDKTEVAALQREDAQKKLGQIASKDLPSRFRLKEALLTLCCLLLCGAMLALPYDLFSVASSGENDEEQQRQERIAEELIEKLRERTQQTDNGDELQKQLDKIINDLEKDLKKGDALDKAAKISEARQKTDRAMEDARSKEELGQALQKHDLTRKLGEAVSKGDSEKAKEALDELQKTLEDDPSKNEQLQKDLQDALNEAQVKEDELKQSLENLEKNLQDGEKKQSDTFEQAKKEIGDALDKQKAQADEQRDLDKMMEDAKQMLLDGSDPEKQGQPQDGQGQEPGEGEEGGGQPGEDGQPAPGEGDGEDGGDQPGEGDGKQGLEGGDGYGEVRRDRTENVYDPISGKVAYGDVYDAYYIEYLNALKDGDVPEEIQKMMDAYFSSLS